jgi:hypothetical protein
MRKMMDDAQAAPLQRKALRRQQQEMTTTRDEGDSNEFARGDAGSIAEVLSDDPIQTEQSAKTAGCSRLLLLRGLAAGALLGLSGSGSGRDGSGRLVLLGRARLADHDVLCDFVKPSV